MDTLEKALEKGLTHHAYCVSGDVLKCCEGVRDWCARKEEFVTQGNPDFVELSYDTFGIDDGRDLQRLQSRRPLGERKVFVVSFNFITREAQNALLKVLEEPSSDTHFFIITPTLEALLPTVRSRVIHIEGGVRNANTDAEIFVSSRVGARMKVVEGIIARIKDDEESKQIALDFVSDVERVWYEKGYDKQALTDLLHVKQYLSLRSSSIKTILEHIALTLPVV